MRYGTIKKTDIANGDGVRVSIWVSGCDFHCPGCFNLESQAYGYGEEFSSSTVQEITESLIPDYISGLTILGGEPLAPRNIEQVTILAKVVRFLFKDKTIWIYTGYEYEEIKDLEILRYIDILVDGRFIFDQKDISLQFKGSRNQRIISVPETIKTGEIVLWRSQYEKARI